MIQEDKTRGIPEFLKHAIDIEVQKITNEEINKAIEKINQKRSQIITGVLLHVQKEVSFESMGNTLKVIVQIKENEKI